nr:Nif3-like dinuclear metal center hexameric protein [Ardenticatena sp.]
MLTAHAIREAIETLAPPTWAESWDNVGWQIGDDTMPVRHVHITLDLDEAVFDEARAHNADLIVSHHPLIFRSLSRIDTATPRGRLIANLIRANIGVYSAHTNLDAANPGVSTALANVLGLSWETALAPLPHAPDAFGYGVICEHEPLSTAELAERVHRRLGTPVPRITDAGHTTHRRTALLGGSGAAFIPQVLAAGCTCFITGEVKYHEAQDARAAGLTIIEADHFYSEAPVLALLAEHLRPLGVSVSVSRLATTPFTYRPTT